MIDSIFVYEPVSYHGKNGNPIKSKAPINGQTALDNSMQVKEGSERRVGVDPITQEIVVLDRTLTQSSKKGEVCYYHGHVREWKDLNNDQKNVLINAGITDRKGKIKYKNY